MINKEIISNGVDIVKVARIEELLQKSIKESFINKVFNEEEIEYFKKRNYNPETIAGYYAVKEAIMKTIGKGIGKTFFKDITILKDDDNKPYVIMSEHGIALMKKSGISEFLISISHEREYAIAFVIAK